MTQGVILKDVVFKVFINPKHDHYLLTMTIAQ
jgi:hypothetical protein